MSDIAISIKHLSKRYLVGHLGSSERYGSLRDTLVRHGRNFGRKAFDMARGRQIIQGDEIEEFWALKDISFEVPRGQVLGIIGHNGAGKSTLLKVLSQITEPTEGRISINGRVASLPEVGTGFHPKLTGRENIFLNGAILGMSRSEIRIKFDEIVSFAEVERFLDTPVKRYSSGMHVRLAFAVAAHLEPEILVVDEVLAVGDQKFKEKCLGKLHDIGNCGRTVIVVSHNMVTMQALCKNVAILEGGKFLGIFPPGEGIRKYIGASGSSPTFSRAPRAGAAVGFTSGRIDLTAGRCPTARFSLRVRASTELRAAIDVRLKDGSGLPVGLASIGSLNPSKMVSFPEGECTINFTIPTASLATGSYIVSIDLTHPGYDYYDRVEDCLKFDVEREAEPGALFAMPQQWGHGCLELSAETVSLESSDLLPTLC